MTFSERFHEIRTGFERPFWVANISELFERLSYYAVFAVLARYLHEGLALRRGARQQPYGNVWRMGLVSRRGWRGGCGPTRLSPRTFAGVSDPEYRLFLAGIDWRDWFAPVRNAVPLVPLVAFVLMLAGTGRRAGEAERGGHHRSRFEGECALGRIFDLLHAGKCWKHAGSIACWLGTRSRQT